MTKPKEPWRCQRCTARGVIVGRATPRSKICTWCADELAQLGHMWCTKGRHGASDWASPTAAMCRACQAAANAAYRAAHLEESLQYSRDYHAAHREEHMAYCHAYYDAHRAQLLEQKKDYYEKNRETIKAKVRAHRPRRSPTSIARERARHEQKRHIYKANERAANLRRKAALWRRMLEREAA